LSTKKWRKLAAENRRLRRENEYLRHRLSLTHPSEEEKRSPSEITFVKRSKKQAPLRARSYLGYLLTRLRGSRLFLIYDKTRFAVRGLFFITKLWTLLVWLFALLGIGAQLVLALGALAIFLPTALLLSAFLGLYGYFVYRKQNAFFEKALLPATKIYFFFLPTNENDLFFHCWIQELSQSGTIFLVSHSFRKVGFSGVRRESNCIYTIHVSYYFSLVKALDPEKIVAVF
jgi:hypothetical protein